jgi:hypothetical protein
MTGRVQSVVVELAQRPVSAVEPDLLATPRVTNQTRPVTPSDLLLFSNNIPCANVLTPPSFITCACDLAFHKQVVQGMLALTRS